MDLDVEKGEFYLEKEVAIDSSDQDRQRQPSPTSDIEDIDKYEKKEYSAAGSSLTSLDHVEQDDSRRKSVQSANAQSAIEWMYIDFDTMLPQPSTSLGRDSITDDINTPPDLSKYKNPFDWPNKKKSAVVWLSTVATALSAYAAGSYTAAIPGMMAEFHVGKVATETGVTAFTCGFGIAPMILAPFSEINGRQPIFMVTGVMFVLFVLICAVTPTLGGMIVARFLTGCASSTFSTMVGGVIADIYKAKDRNKPMTIYTGGVFFGTGFGPMVSGFIAQHKSWRWVFWIHLMLVGVLVIALVLIFDETRGSVLLSRKARALNKWYEKREAAGYYGFDIPSSLQKSEKTLDPSKPSTLKIPASRRIRWKTKEAEQLVSLPKMIAISLYRPFHMLVTEPVVFFFSLWISFAWAVLYLCFSVIPYAYETVYKFDLQDAYAIFAAVSAAGIICVCYSILQDKLANRYGLLPDSPEARLYFTCIEGMFLPIGLFWFGWTVRSSIHWIVPAIAISFSVAGIFSIYLAVFNYLADGYHKYASSAIAAQSFCRNMLAGAFPLFAQQMFHRMGFGGGGSFLGGLALLLSIVPWVLVFFGSQIRARSKICSQLASGAS